MHAAASRLILGILWSLFTVLSAHATVSNSTANRLASTPGMTAGNFSVDDSGAARYHMGLIVPPGTGGMQPALSLSYHSRSGNGLLGHGWTLGGLSVITRCAQTLALDGVVGRVNFDTHDRYCLDGQRLIVTQGNYGADGSAYRTELDQFSKIIVHDTDPQRAGPEAFTVYTRSGQILEYGHSADSQIAAVGLSPETASAPLRLWAVNKISDTVGNYLTLHYSTDPDSGSYKPLRIDYTGNSQTGLTPYAAVEFEYQSRPDRIPMYYSGAHLHNSERISHIKTYVDQSLVKDYQLSYSNTGAAQTSRLTSITECDGSAVPNCYPPTEFNWQSAENAGYFNTAISASPSGGAGYLNHNYVTGDFNGDGITDLLWHRANSSSGCGSYCGTGGDAYYKGLKTEVMLGNGRGGFLPGRSSAPRTSGDFRSFKLATGDVNGDGLTDLIWHKASNGSKALRAFVALGLGDGRFATAISSGPRNSGNFADYQLATGDFNGDGLTDLVWHKASSDGLRAYVALSDGISRFGAAISNAPNTSNNCNGYSLTTGDFNGDGLTDLVWHKASSSGLHAYSALADGTGRFNAAIKSRPRSSGNFSDYQFATGDFNGDGLTDLLWHKASSSSGLYAYSALADGTGRFNAAIKSRPRSSGNFSGFSLVTGDFNGDGLTDLVWRKASSSSGLYAYSALADGTGRFSDDRRSYPRTSGNFSDYQFATGDFNGDGVTDLVWHNISGGLRSYTALAASTPVQLTEITHGLGNRTHISYAPLTDAAHYRKGNQARYPEVDLQGPLYIVSTVRQDDNHNPRHSHYHYSQAKSALLHGFLGFARIRRTDLETGLISQTDYSQQYPYIGQIQGTEQRYSQHTLDDDSDDLLLSQTEHQFAYHITAHGTGTYSANHLGIVFPYTAHSTQRDYQPDLDSQSSRLIKTTSTEHHYDSDGNPTQISVRLTDETRNQTFVTHTENDYDQTDRERWIFGRLSRARVTQYLPNHSGPLDGSCSSNDQYAIDTYQRTCGQRESAFSYSPDGLLASETTEPDSALEHHTAYTRDAYGNIADVHISGADIAPRSRSNHYDARGQFAISSSNALGHSETRVYDPHHGVLLEQTGPNQLTTRWDYDRFGRVIQETRADGSYTQTQRHWCANTDSQDADCPDSGVLAITTRSAGSPTQTTYSDVHGRTVRTVTQSHDGSLIYVDSVYDELGRLSRQSRPYFVGDPVYWQQTDYDALSRPIQETAPDGSSSQTEYDAYRISVINSSGQRSEQISNARGALIQAIDALGNQTDYQYSPFGELVVVQDSAAHITTNDYDLSGRKVKMNDMDMGIWHYEYNVLGALTRQEDPQSQAVSLYYDLLGRLTQRMEAEGTSTWEYDSAANGIGKLASVSGPTGSAQKTEHYEYDSYGRLQHTHTNLGADRYTLSQHYDEYGRIAQLTYPASHHHSQGLRINHSYSATGYLEQVYSEQTTYWQLEQHNAAGQLERVTLGNGITQQHQYEHSTGRIQHIEAHKTQFGDRQQLSFSFDPLGNLTQRQDLLRGTAETFGYDSLNRMTYSQLSQPDGVSEKHYSYDALGNLTYKTGIGDYHYTSVRPHAVTEAGGHQIDYDGNGNVTHNWNFTLQQSRHISWTSYNKPYHIRQGETELYFSYGANRERYQQRVHNAEGISTRWYINSLFERDQTGGVDTAIHYIQAAGETIGLYKSKSDGTEKTQYLHKDHLGSITDISDEVGDIVESLAYDPHGKRRQAVNWEDALAPIISREIKRCFTNHSYLDDVGLIHMGGRMYDPDLGRFTSPDPFVQEVSNAQSLNRYSYVVNNPLSYTDPSGFISLNPFKAVKSIFKAVGSLFKGVAKVIKAVVGEARTIAAIGVAAVVTAAGCPTCGGFAAGMIASGGDVKAGILGAVTAGAFHGIGTHFDKLANAAGGTLSAAQSAAKVLAHGAVGGIANEIGGGDFVSGFASAGFVQAFSQLGGFEALGASDVASSVGEYVHNAVASALVGGTAAVLGGGKFKSGVITGSFSRLFNDLGSANLGSPQDLADGIRDEQNRIGTLLEEGKFLEEFSQYGLKKAGLDVNLVLETTGNELIRELEVIKIDAIRNGMNPNLVSEAASTASAIGSAAPKTGLIGGILGVIDLFKWSGGANYRFNYQCNLECDVKGIEYVK